MAIIETDFIFNLELNEPKLLAIGSSFPALRFNVSMGHAELGKIWTIPGFRIINGKITPPARKAGKGWAAIVKLENADFLLTLDKMVQIWKPDFPEVRFPEVSEVPSE